MKPRRLIAAAAGLACAALAHAGAQDRHAASPFGWLADLAGHCWQAVHPQSGGKVQACWSFDASRQTLQVRTRDASGATALSTVRMEQGWQRMVTSGSGGAATHSCWLMPAVWNADGEALRPGARNCRFADPRSTLSPPASWTYRIEPVSRDRYRVVEVYEYGGWAHAMPQQRVWLFVRSGTPGAPAVNDRKGAGDSGCGGE